MLPFELTECGQKAKKELLLFIKILISVIISLSALGLLIQCMSSNIQYMWYPQIIAAPPIIIGMYGIVFIGVTLVTLVVLFDVIYSYVTTKKRTISNSCKLFRRKEKK